MSLEQVCGQRKHLRRVEKSKSSFMSPQRTAEKRSCWDITTANSPSIATLNGRRRRSYISSACSAAPSMLLQAMFAFACFFYIYSMMNLINYFYRNLMYYVMFVFSIGQFDGLKIP